MSKNSNKQTKYIFITGGVVSSLGKGIVAASLGSLLKSRSYKVSMLKMDPYINVDPGTMSPYQHGEVYVTEDGMETDLDLGHYERFLNILTSEKNSFTAGKVYETVINEERRGKLQGKTVQVIPHITNEIIRRIELAGEDSDYCIVEVGGTCGDIESLPFLEAIRQLSVKKGMKKSLFVHLTLLPYVKAAQEIKTKPTQHSVKELRSIGIQPNILVCRTESEISNEIKEKIALFTNVDSNAVFSSPDSDTIYKIPLILAKQGMDQWVEDYFSNLGTKADLSEWKSIVNRINNPKKEIKIALVGKYVKLTDAYKSVNEALIHAGIRNYIKINIVYLDSDSMAKNTQNLWQVDGILVPGGFDKRGIVGKIETIKFARENKIPLLGICLGMQLIIIEYAKNVLGIVEANSTEWEKNTPDPIIALVKEWQNMDGSISKRDEYSKMGATMRLGTQKATLKKGTIAYQAYKQSEIFERHRHRYEFNNNYLQMIEQGGLVLSAFSEQNLVEMVELNQQTHPWLVGCQFHPEFKSTPQKGHPIFLSFIKAVEQNKFQNND